MPQIMGPAPEAGRGRLSVAIVSTMIASSNHSILDLRVLYCEGYVMWLLQSELRLWQTPISSVIYSFLETLCLCSWPGIRLGFAACITMQSGSEAFREWLDVKVVRAVYSVHTSTNCKPQIITCEFHQLVTCAQTTKQKSWFPLETSGCILLVWKWATITWEANFGVHASHAVRTVSVTVSKTDLAPTTKEDLTY